MHMQKAVIAITILTLAVFVFLIYKNQNTAPQKSSAASTKTPAANTEKNQSVIVDNFTISWFEIPDIDNLKLIPNFTEKNSSREIVDKNNCKFLSNSTFYSTDSKPLGLFVTNGQTLNNWQQNDLLDGILSTNDMATPRITRDVPKDSLKIAIQTGPILKENNSWLNLKIKEDGESRRVLAAVTGTNKLFFLTVYNSNSEYSGPLLGELPKILQDFETKSEITFADAINLDGGSASTFKTKDVSLSELTPVGAFFCQL